MSKGSPECAHARLQIGGDPHELPAEMIAHLASCAECRQFREETLLLDGRLLAALELPLAQFRPAPGAAPARRFALAASVAFAVLLAGGFWALRPQPALAGEVVQHVLHEPGSWEAGELLSASDVADVFTAAGVEFDASLPVVYAYACPFNGHRVPHLVVQTADGPMTVMLLAHEKVSKRTEFTQDGLHGVLLPAGAGSVAVLVRAGQLPDDLAGKIVSAVRW